MPEDAEPVAEDYWSRLVQAQSAGSLDQVGQSDMGQAFNRQGYKIRLRAVEAALRDADSDLKSARVFEAGFGVGFYLGLWERVGASVVGVDLAATAVANVQSRFPGFDLRSGSIETIDSWDDWPSLAGSFDVVNAIDVLYHIVDDGAARRAVALLGLLLRPGGILLFTEKFPPAGDCLRERPHVTRRPLHWYQAALRPHVRLERVAPVFWCMDPALSCPRRSLGDRLARLAWISMRASTKYFPSRSPIQEAVGGVVGYVGAGLDRILVGEAASGGNMRIVTMRRDER